MALKPTTTIPRPRVTLSQPGSPPVIFFFFSKNLNTYLFKGCQLHQLVKGQSDIYPHAITCDECVHHGQNRGVLLPAIVAILLEDEGQNTDGIGKFY